MKKKKGKISTEEEVARYWESHDATEMMDLSLKRRDEIIYEPPVESISLRLPVPLLTQIKRISSGMDIAYQALIKIWLAEKAKEKLFQQEKL